MLRLTFCGIVSFTLSKIPKNRPVFFDTRLWGNVLMAPIVLYFKTIINIFKWKYDVAVLHPVEKKSVSLTGETQTH